MQKILLIGNGPLNPNSKENQSAYSIRTQMFYQFLTSQKYTVKTILQTKNPAKSKNLSVLQTSLEGRRYANFLQKQIDLFQPDFIISANNANSYVVSKLKFRAHFIADLNGWLPGEAQSQAQASQSNYILPQLIAREKQVLRTADFLLTCSENQKKATIGELAMVGKLTHQNFDKKMVGKLMNFVQPKLINQAYDLKLPKNAIVLGWLSGFNNWADEDLLLELLIPSLKNNSNLYFVCTGGAYSDLPNGKYEKVYKSLKKAKLLGQCRLLNWVHNKYVADIISQFHLGLNTDLDCLESHFGARNRITDLIANGVPVLSTDYSEVASQLSLFGIGIGFTHSETAKVKEFLKTLTLADVKLYRKNLKTFNKAQKLANYMQDLTAYLKQPFKANLACLKTSRLKTLRYYLRQHGLKKLLQKIIAKI